MTVGYPAHSVTADRKLHLAFLASPNEGAARDWMAWFADRGHRVGLIVRAEADVVAGLHPEIEVVRMPPYRGVLFGRVSSIDARRAVGESLRKLNPDILHVHDLTTGFGWLARVSGFHPYVLTPWGTDLYRYAPSARGARVLTWLALRGADLVTVNSRNLGAAAIRLGARPATVDGVQFGIEPAAFQPVDPDPTLRTRLGLDARRVVFAPRQIHPLYDQVSVVRALPHLPSDVVVVMSARAAIGPTLAALEGVADDLRVRDRLVIVPTIPHDEMPAYLALADVLVTVPQSDATAVTILEALAAGVPVVGSDLASPREWLDSTWPDLIVPVGDPKAIANAVATALALEPDTLRRRTAEARAFVIERAERDESMRRMERHYLRLAARAGRMKPQ